MRRVDVAEPRNVDQRIEEQRIVFFFPPPSIIHPAVTRGLWQKSIFVPPVWLLTIFWKRKEEKKGRPKRQISRLFSSLPPPSLTLLLGMVRWRYSRKTRRRSDSSSVLVRRRVRFGVKSQMWRLLPPESRVCVVSHYLPHFPLNGK